MERDAERAVNKVMSGHVAHHAESIRDGWRAAFEHRKEAVDVICTRLASAVWQEAPRGAAVVQFGALLALLDALDRDVFSAQMIALQNQKLHPVQARTRDLMAHRVGEAPVMMLAEGLPVYLADTLHNKDDILDHLKRWVQTPGLELENINRIDVIQKSMAIDYLGLYSVYYSCIVLVWPARRQRGLGLWAKLKRAEFTFYHEVGHHASGHLEGGSVAEQEDEADAFALRSMARAYPRSFAVLRVLIWPLRPLLRRLAS